jgi:hypothetical protein
VTCASRERALTIVSAVVHMRSVDVALDCDVDGQHVDCVTFSRLVISDACELRVLTGTLLRYALNVRNSIDVLYCDGPFEQKLNKFKAATAAQLSARSSRHGAVKNMLATLFHVFLL